MKSILIVGAGFAGAVYARQLAQAGYQIDIIDKRPHIAGHCYDYVHGSGVRVHHYGPHLFHTSNQRVVDWLSQFTQWLPYAHRVLARLPDGRLTPMPVNLKTVNDVFHTQLTSAQEVAACLAQKARILPGRADAESFLYRHIGPELTDLFYRPYTKKMWQMDLSDMSADVVRRLKIRTDHEDRYFPDDAFQALPAQGYTALFEKMLDHPAIRIRLQCAFSDALAAGYDACFNAMPIDEYYGFDLGELPYRSIRFHLEEVPAPQAAHHCVINYTDTGPYTRETWWHHMPGHVVEEKGRRVRTVEEPCDYRDNGYARFYPVKTPDGRYEALHARYAARTPRHKDMRFIGRCGTYQYLDMHQVINQSLIGAEKWLAEQER